MCAVHICTCSRCSSHSVCLVSFSSMDENGPASIDWSEWRDYHLLPPADNVPQILLYWKHSTVGCR